MQGLPLSRRVWVNPPRIAVALLALLGAGACNGTTAPDAYGNFEAEEVVLAAQTSGPIVRFDALEGQRLDLGTVVAVVDTVPLTLERRQLIAQHAALVLRRTELAAQLASLDAQLEIAERTLSRTERLRDGDAATSAQLDGAEREVRVLRAQRDAVRASSASLTAELRALDARVAAVADRLSRATVTSPIAGTVLATYARAGEMVQPGQPLVAVADLSTLTLRAYVTGGQLASFRLGQRVTVRADADGSLAEFEGEIAWVSARAEFTPTPVQTRDDRANLVYAVKIRVRDPNGRLKIGMPGDVTL